MDLGDPAAAALLAAEALEAAGIPHALYGGLLLAAYGEPRETRDVDLAVVDASAAEVAAALRRAGLRTAPVFEDLALGGLDLDRLAFLGRRSDAGVNTLDLVRPRSPRYREAAIGRSRRIRIRERPIRVLDAEDFVLFKALSTRDRDLHDAASVVLRMESVLDRALLRREAAALARELPEAAVPERMEAVQALAEDLRAGRPPGAAGTVGEGRPPRPRGPRKPRRRARP